MTICTFTSGVNCAPHFHWKSIDHAWTQDSKWGLTKALYFGTKFSASWQDIGSPTQTLFPSCLCRHSIRSCQRALDSQVIYFAYCTCCGKPFSFAISTPFMIFDSCFSVIGGIPNKFAQFNARNISMPRTAHPEGPTALITSVKKSKFTY